MKLNTNHPYHLTLIKISESSTVNQIYLIVMALIFSCYIKSVSETQLQQPEKN